MDISMEQLQLIITMLNQLGDNVTVGFIIWVVLSNIGTGVMWIIALTVAGLILRSVVVYSHNHSIETSLPAITCNQLCSMLLAARGGYHTSYSINSKVDHNFIVQRVTDLINKERENENLAR